MLEIEMFSAVKYAFASVGLLWRRRTKTLIGDVKFGVIMLGAFWLGRAVPVWIAPMLIADVRGVDNLVEAVRDSRRDFARIHLLGVAACVVALVVLLGTSTELGL